MTRAELYEELEMLMDLDEDTLKAIETRTRSYPLEAANQALVDLKQGRIQGSAILELGRADG